MDRPQAIALFIIFIMIYIVMRHITLSLNIFFAGSEIIFTLLLIIAIVVYKINRRLSYTSYTLFIMIFLLFRKKSTVNFNFDFYLIDWLIILYINKIVFINVIGNVILFIPFILYLRNKYFIFYIILIILSFELIQLLTKRGVFDIVDIVLNIFGVLLGTIFIRRIHGTKR
jgi:glycopeptide antibiotics resistance protein